jgi:hypothetical protein
MSHLEKQKGTKQLFILALVILNGPKYKYIM